MNMWKVLPFALLTASSLPVLADVELVRTHAWIESLEFPCRFAGQSMGHATYSWKTICAPAGFEPWQQAFLKRCPEAEKPPFFSGGPEMGGWFDAAQRVKAAFPEVDFSYRNTEDGDFARYTNLICEHADQLGLLEQG